MLHYHVVANCHKASIPAKVLSTQQEACNEFKKISQLVIDVTGAYTAYVSEQVHIMSDGSTVKWFSCDKDCNTVA